MFSLKVLDKSNTEDMRSYVLRLNVLSVEYGMCVGVRSLGGGERGSFCLKECAHTHNKIRLPGC